MCARRRPEPGVECCLVRLLRVQLHAGAGRVLGLFRVTFTFQSRAVPVLHCRVDPAYGTAIRWQR